MSSVALLQVIAEKVDKPRDIEFKGATDLVTDTDKASEEAVLSVSPCLPSAFRHSPKMRPLSAKTCPSACTECTRSRLRHA